ncbi:MAG: hypothetical protein [Circoviridae sp.]|nr:MAG: hypothetical protein [Circoviridae sp.]
MITPRFITRAWVGHQSVIVASQMRCNVGHTCFLARGLSNQNCACRCLSCPSFSTTATANGCFSNHVIRRFSVDSFNPFLGFTVIANDREVFSFGLGICSISRSKPLH